MISAWWLLLLIPAFAAGTTLGYMAFVCSKCDEFLEGYDAGFYDGAESKDYRHILKPI